MIPAVFGKLKDSGFFFDPIARDIEINFMPNLLAKVKSKVRAKLGEKSVLESLCKSNKLKFSLRKCLTRLHPLILNSTQK